MVIHQVPKTTDPTAEQGITMDGSHQGTSLNTLGTGKAIQTSNMTIANPTTLTPRTNVVRMA